MKIHPDITLDRVIEAVERHQNSLDNPGFCTLCGAAADGVEPDARKYECESCGNGRAGERNALPLSVRPVQGQGLRPRYARP